MGGWPPATAIRAPASGVPVSLAAPSGTFTEQNLVTGGTATAQGSVSSLAGCQPEFIAVSPDSVAVTATTPSAFLLGGQGADDLVATSGNNLLDAGTGPTLMIGGSGSDAFDIDAKGATTWDAVANFHAGDRLVLWGATQGVCQLSWTETQTQAVLTVTGGGVTSAGVGLVGVSAAQAHQLVVSGGTAGGLNYLMLTQSLARARG